MARAVKTLVAGLELPDGNLYPAIDTTVILTDDEYALLDPNIFDSDLQDLGQALTSVTPGASPYTLTATTPELVVLNPNGATISALSFNGVAIPVTTSIVPLSFNDTLTVTYSGGTPTVHTRTQ
jgi:hypothetical protein